MSSPFPVGSLALRPFLAIVPRPCSSRPSRPLFAVIGQPSRIQSLPPRCRPPGLSAQRSARASPESSTLSSGSSPCQTEVSISAPARRGLPVVGNPPFATHLTCRLPRRVRYPSARSAPTSIAGAIELCSVGVPRRSRRCLGIIRYSIFESRRHDGDCRIIPPTRPRIGRSARLVFFLLAPRPLFRRFGLPSARSGLAAAGSGAGARGHR